MTVVSVCTQANSMVLPHWEMIPTIEFGRDKPAPEEEISWFLQCHIFATSEDIADWVLICDSAQSWQHYSVGLVGNQAAERMR